MLNQPNKNRPAQPHPPHRRPYYPPRPMGFPHPTRPPRPSQPPSYPSGIDYGPHPFVIDINKATLNNENFRSVLWTGKHLQLTLMHIGVGEDIGLEVHPHVDQFLRIEEGQALVMMGDHSNRLNFRQPVYDDFAIFIPAGTWHNIINTGKKPIKLYSIYAPPSHPKGAIHATKAFAEKMESH